MEQTGILKDVANVGRIKPPKSIMKTRTLSVMCFVIFALIAIDLYRHNLPWWTIAIPWTIGGAIAFRCGSGLIRAKQFGSDYINVAMCLLMTVLGIVGLALTSFTDLGSDGAFIESSKS
ncbi:hypothetical protein H7X65_02080 [Candidatus Parcubacteria bacterium]|nr:hypothetical protein [Candidatus Parcubacteria bacterium]